jgi:hypothetical protein
MKSASSLNYLSLSEKFRQGLTLGLMHLRRNQAAVFEHFEEFLPEYNGILARYSRPPLEESKVLEIGFGARPFRLVWLHCSKINIYGVDLDRPLLRPSLRNLLEIARKNGVERAMKSLIRYFLTDRNQWSQLASALKTSGRTFDIPHDRLIVANAQDAGFWKRIGGIDVIYSEDVFEHIPKEQLLGVVENMASALSPRGIAVIRPMIFTGICGGHHLEWYPHTLNESTPRKTEPWEHLRQDRFPASTYLNRLAMKDYVEIFQQHFKILEQTIVSPGLGSAYLTPEIRNELSNYTEEELLSNTVRFVLEPV